MGAADIVLFATLAVVDVCVLAYIHHRRQKRVRMERMMRSLRSVVRREIGTGIAAEPADTPELALAQAS